MAFFSPFDQFSRAVVPTLPLLGLTDDEKQMIVTLQAQAMLQRQDMLLADAYRRGQQVIQNLRIAVPKELEFLRTIVGWPAKAVDPYVARLSVDCFRVPTATDGDEHLMALMAANGFDGEQSLAFDDALTMGHALWSVGSGVEKGDVPLITVESPLNMTVLWDLRGLTPRAAMSEYHDDDRKRGALILPGKTVHIAQGDSGEWEITSRDEHGYDFVPVGRMAHKPTTNNRNGTSAITPAVRSLTDAACRSLLGLEVSRERYSVPQTVLMGAAESAFQKADGTAKTAWDTYITRILALERDDDGNLPEIKQLQPYDPATFTKLLDWYASAMSGELLATPQSLGLYTQGNPPSAEAVIAMNAERDLAAVQMQKQFGVSLVRIAQTALRFENGGVLPEQYKALIADWNPVTLPNPAATSDAITKQITAGAVPATSDVTLKRLGYTAVERARLAQDRVEDDARNMALALAQGLVPQQGATSGDAASL